MNSKIIHFPNLVCWEDIFEDFDISRDALKPEPPPPIITTSNCCSENSMLPNFIYPPNKYLNTNI